MRLDWHGHDADVYMQRGRMRAVCAEEVVRGMACADGWSVAVREVGGCCTQQEQKEAVNGRTRGFQAVYKDEQVPGRDSRESDAGSEVVLHGSVHNGRRNYRISRACTVHVVVIIIIYSRRVHPLLFDTVVLFRKGTPLLSPINSQISCVTGFRQVHLIS